MTGAVEPAAIPWPTLAIEPMSAAERAASRAALLDTAPAAAPVWVFGYGSLMWQPCFEPAERRPGRIRGYRRSFCFWTMVARGTPERPGLGLGLEPAEGAVCHGVAYRLSDATREADLVALWDREMYSGVYQPRWIESRLDTESGEGEVVRAITFVIDPAHPQYCPPLTLDQRAEIIAGAAGKFGPCAEYLEDTVSHLAAFDAVEPEIAVLRDRVRALCGRARAGST